MIPWSLFLKMTITNNRLDVFRKQNSAIKMLSDFDKVSYLISSVIKNKD